MTKLSKKMMVALLCFSASLSVSVAQENEPKIATDLNTLITKSSSYQNYKVIEKNAIYGFQNSLNTFIKEQEQIQNTLNKEIAENKKSILLLQNEIQELKQNNAVLTEEKASISFLGMLVSKDSYSVTMWTLFLGTLAVAGILFYKFKTANAVTSHSKTVLKDLEEEYESYRRVCIEREQSLRRQLFEEAKKNKELKNVS
ncbi:MAG: hypothetical protein CMP76_09150 [Flavobacterium sp.]|uniref:hypothetical protein n=1 Tax=unclassified Flavobacterium TaxID=196869 RepID=UPI000C587D8A|nr:MULTISPECIES: hypothetical protein [unclassified Flavobacterium]MBF03448.1 hypothetical protein [Flavobacterium sp.]MCO6162015.1 hypothetical protein [Flavobacterium sp. NRK F7]|tara:strand:+ start:1357 stop:1956 length:600 start_codon:yes stop_codon:yes gene_type:complete